MSKNTHVYPIIDKNGKQCGIVTNSKEGVADFFASFAKDHYNKNFEVTLRSGEIRLVNRDSMMQCMLYCRKEKIDQDVTCIREID
jgi:hypothetical protein